jgi:formylglycine-generating enzyme required for sulfatase activity
VFFILYSCSSSQKVVVNGKVEELPKPINTAQIGNNLFMDETEISNINWKEYLYWTNKIYGNEAKKAALPDTTVWKLNDSSLNVPLVKTYFNHPAYKNYPVVGLTYEQVIAYSKWRSDRVFEMILLAQNENLKNALSNENYFSIERYFNGEIEGVQPDFSIPYPNYRLPSKTEWELAAKGFTNDDYGVNIKNKTIRKSKNQGRKLFNIKEYNSKDATITAPVRSFVENDFGLYNMIGNVSEMVLEKNISKGGGFDQELTKVKISNDIVYEKPARWLGFRNICEYQYWKNEG